MHSGYSDVSWFLRAARVVPVIAGAALLGGMIGGFAMFAIDSALTWEPNPPSRPEARADNQASVVNPQPTKPVRIVGGAIPDPSAGMSAPPPAAQQQRSATTPAPSQISSQLLTPKPLGPASQLQPQTATAAAAQTPSATRWPDALSRAHQNAANAENTPSAQQQTAPPPAAAQTNDRAASADDQSGADTSRYGRHNRRQMIVGTNGFRNGGDDDSAATSSPRRRDARSYDRLYDSYGSRRDRSYRNSREQFYGAGDESDAASRSDLSRSDMRRLGRDARYRGRSRVIDREQPEESDRTQAFEPGRPRSEPFWGGGFFRRGDQNDD
jgi:hypothetical protein